MTGTVLAVDEPKLLSYSWGEDEILRFELHPDGDGHPLARTASCPTDARTPRMGELPGHGLTRSGPRGSATSTPTPRRSSQ